MAHYPISLIVENKLQTVEDLKKLIKDLRICGETIPSEVKEKVFKDLSEYYLIDTSSKKIDYSVAKAFSKCMSMLGENGPLEVVLSLKRQCFELGDKQMLESVEKELPQLFEKFEIFYQPEIEFLLKKFQSQN